MTDLADTLKAALLAPLQMPARAVRDLDTIASVVASLERVLQVRLGSVDASTTRLNDQVAELNGQIAALQIGLETIIVRLDTVEESVTSTKDTLQAALQEEIAALRPPLEQMAADLAQATAMLPDPERDGPLARLRDAITPD